MTYTGIIGIDIGGTKISSGYLTLKGDLLDTVTVPTMADKTKEVFLKQLKLSVDKLLAHSSLSINSVKGIGVCCPGPINPKTGDILNPPNLPALWDSNLIRLINQFFPIDVKVENDANAAGYAETKIGAAKGYENVLYVTVSTGVGTGIIINGKIYHGKNGFAGEGGHLSTDYYGEVYCNCKAPACIESIASGTAITRKARELVLNAQTSGSRLDTFKNNPENLTAKEVSQFALENDPLALSIIEESAFNIGAWLGGMINLLDPDIIVIGGGVASIGEVFFNKVRSVSLDFTYNLHADKTPIVEALLKNNVGIYGAASLFLD